MAFSHFFLPWRSVVEIAYTDEKRELQAASLGIPSTCLSRLRLSAPLVLKPAATSLDGDCPPLKVQFPAI
jgi:hypothetical protein